MTYRELSNDQSVVYLYALSVIDGSDYITCCLMYARELFSTSFTIVKVGGSSYCCKLYDIGSLKRIISLYQFFTLWIAKKR